MLILKYFIGLMQILNICITDILGQIIVFLGGGQEAYPVHGRML